MPESPPTLRGAAVVQAAEAAIVLIASVLSGVATTAGRSYHLSSGIALTVIGVACAAALVIVAVGLARARRWTRTPALLTQLFFGIVGIYLLQGDRLEWGVPSVTLAAAGFAALLSPPSVRALISPRPGQARTAPGRSRTGTGEPQAGPTKARARPTGAQARGARPTDAQTGPKGARARPGSKGAR